MSRIQSLALFGIISILAWFTHGVSVIESHPPGTRSAGRRRKTPLELIQIGAGSSSRGSSTVLDIGSQANNGFGKLIAERDEGQSAHISVQSENRGIIGPKKNQTGEGISKKGDSNSKKDVNQRESPMVQEMNENIKKQEVTTMTEPSALMKMMLLSDSGYGMSMSMPPAGSPSELSTMNSVGVGVPTISTQGGGGIGNIVPVTVPTINDGPPKNIGATVMPAVITAATVNGEEIISRSDGDEDVSSAPFSTLSQLVAVTIIVVSIMVVSFY